MSTSKLPIRVSPHVTESGKRGWRWTCSDHPRSRGQHNLDRFTDWVLARSGKPPADHPFVRAMRGATEHWHKRHAPEHHCCTLVNRKATP